mgnify:CR=1 FL=1
MALRGNSQRRNNMQMHFTEINLDAYEIDERQTKQAAMKLLTRYRLFKLGATDYDLKLTATYSIQPKHFGNEFHSDVESNVVKKVSYMQVIEEAVNKIPDPDERRVIVDGYMTNEKHNYIKMQQRLHMNTTNYYKLRNKALISFAVVLNKEVFKEKKN